MVELVVFLFFKICCVILCNCLSTGSLGARITELKQKVIAENPRRYGLAVPRKSLFFKVFPLGMQILSVSG